MTVTEYDCVFIVEEKSMKLFLDKLLDRIKCSKGKGWQYKIIVGNGKDSLLHAKNKKIKKTVKGREIMNNLKSLSAGCAYDTQKIIALIDRDTDNCQELKQKMQGLMAKSHNKRGTETISVVVCSELESWYFGCPAILASYSKNPNFAKQRSFRDITKFPDVFDQNNGGKPSDKNESSYENT